MQDSEPATFKFILSGEDELKLQKFILKENEDLTAEDVQPLVEFVADELSEYYTIAGNGQIEKNDDVAVKHLITALQDYIARTPDYWDTELCINCLHGIKHYINGPTSPFPKNIAISLPLLGITWVKQSTLLNKTNAALDHLIYRTKNKLIKLSTYPSERIRPLAVATHTYFFSTVDAQQQSTKTEDKKGNTPLMQALEDHKPKIVFDLLEQQVTDINKQNNRGETALMMAANYGYLNIVDKLLEKGADPNLKDTMDFTALIYATIKRHRGIIELLLNKSHTDINILGPNGHSAIFVSLKLNNLDLDLDIVNLLLDDKRINLDLKDGHGNTLLHAAIYSASHDIIKKILRKGANPNLKDKKSQTALMFAVLKGRKNIVKSILRNTRTDINLQDNVGETALFYAVKTVNRIAITKLILADDRIDLNVQNNNGDTILHLAVLFHNVDFIKKIIRKNPYIINKKNKKDQTALGILQFSGRPPTIAVPMIELLKNYAETQRDQSVNRYRTPLTENYIDTHRNSSFLCHENPQIEPNSGETSEHQTSKNENTFIFVPLLIVVAGIGAFIYFCFSNKSKNKSNLKQHNPQQETRTTEQKPTPKRESKTQEPPLPSDDIDQTSVQPSSSPPSSTLNDSQKEKIDTMEKTVPQEKINDLIKIIKDTEQEYATLAKKISDSRMEFMPNEHSTSPYHNDYIKFLRDTTKILENADKLKKQAINEQQTKIIFKNCSLVESQLKSISNELKAYSSTYETVKNCFLASHTEKPRTKSFSLQSTDGKEIKRRRTTATSRKKSTESDSLKLYSVTPPPIASRSTPDGGRERRASIEAGLRGIYSPSNLPIDAKTTPSSIRRRSSSTSSTTFFQKDSKDNLPKFSENLTAIRRFITAIKHEEDITSVDTKKITSTLRTFSKQGCMYFTAQVLKCYYSKGSHDRLDALQHNLIHGRSLLQNLNLSDLHIIYNEFINTVVNISQTEPDPFSLAWLLQRNGSLKNLMGHCTSEQPINEADIFTLWHSMKGERILLEENAPLTYQLANHFLSALANGKKEENFNQMLDDNNVSNEEQIKFFAWLRKAITEGNALRHPQIPNYFLDPHLSNTIDWVLKKIAENKRDNATATGTTSYASF